MRLPLLAVCAAIVAAACGSSSDSPSGDASCADCTNDGGALPAADAAIDAPMECAPLADVGDAGAGPAHVVYPDPAYASVGRIVARVKTACVDTGALASHATIDALVPTILAEAGVSAAPRGCGCDWSIAFASAPPMLDAAATKALMDAGTSDERYVVVSSAERGRATSQLFAASERGAMYALRAALGMSAANAAGTRDVAAGTVVDHPGIAWRGVIEGIYGTRVAQFGTQWTPGERAKVIRMMPRLRQNTFIYGPKGDPYSAGQWREAYPRAVQGGVGAGQAIEAAATDAESNLVRFVWAMRPFVSFDWNNYASELAALKAKIDSVRKDERVRHFAMFMDDLTVSASIAQQAKVMNDVNAYIKSVDPSDHLLVVWWHYAGGANGSSDALGPLVDPSVEIMWTGPCIESCTIDAASMNGVDASFKRKMSIWDNWPTSTGCCGGAASAPKMTGRSADLATVITGFYTNPVVNECGPECGGAMHVGDFVAHLGPIADYAWGPARYGANVDASYARWSPIMAAYERDFSCAKTTCSASGPVYPGWTCDAQKQGLYFCDSYNADCVTAFACAKGCSLQASGTPDVCLH